MDVNPTVWSSDINRETSRVAEMEELGMSDESRVEPPRAGMTFDSVQLATTYLSCYGKSIGFQWRRRTSWKRTNGSEGGMRFECSKAGEHMPRGRKHLTRPRPSGREGCPVHLSMIVVEEGRCKINKVYLEHSHDLDPSRSRYLPAYRFIPPHMRERIVQNDRSGISVSKTYTSLVVENQGMENVPALQRDCRNYLMEERKLFKEAGDAEALLGYFKKMQADNNNFFHEFDLDADSRVKNIFWADARSRAAYSEFGDVLYFDTTYLKNRYDMPVAPFVGVNHHGQTILFGCRLVSHENIPTFIWLFEAFLRCMG